MSTKNRKRMGLLTRRVFEMLLAHPEGLHFRAIARDMRQRQALNGSNNNQADEIALCSIEEIACGCIAPIKAGWLLDKNDTFSVSAAGADAYVRYEDPERFMIEAARLDRKSTRLNSSHSRASRMPSSA